MTVPIILIFVFASLAVLFLCLFIKERQRRRKWELACYCQKFEDFKRRSMEIKSISDGANLQEQYKKAVPATFLEAHLITHKLKECLVKKITATIDPDKLSLIIGGDFVSLKDEKTCEGKIWKSLEFEVRSHLKVVYQTNNDATWLRPLMN